ncbi:hypothetical protein [Nocardia mexicana]|uniref:Uncharacterized protein n=1 Tax=Nocardia mexicana TaxID=279262 RepID=A0A370H9H9_9NOCA|nr:hypothetical protein [Nocardia mexicana]RDI53199.1 hypothetical protein DFR68_103587 [Nocardia mexicana]
MSHRQHVRTMVVALLGGAILAAGSGASAGAAPGTGDYPLGGGSPGTQQKSEPEKRAEKVPEKAEKLGGSTTGKILDLGEHIIKCGLNIATPEIKCPS